MFFKVIIIVVVSMCPNVIGDELPADLKPCKFGDIECIKTTVDFIFKDKSQGDPAISLPQLFPLKIESVHLEQGEESPVTLDLKLTNNNMYGIETAKVVKVKGFGKDLTQKHYLHLHTDYLSTVGDYDVNGKILILPIKGSGKSNITMVDIDLYVSFVGTPLEKDGEVYMDVKQLTLDVKPKKMLYKVENLFNGDKALGDNMNLFLNENWREIFNEVRASLTKAYGEVFRGVINSVFSKFPYNKYLSE